MCTNVVPSNSTCSRNTSVESVNFPESWSLVTLVFPFYRGIYFESHVIGSPPSASNSSTPWYSSSSKSTTFSSCLPFFSFYRTFGFFLNECLTNIDIFYFSLVLDFFTLGDLYAIGIGVVDSILDILGVAILEMATLELTTSMGFVVVLCWRMTFWFCSGKAANAELNMKSSQN